MSQLFYRYIRPTRFNSNRMELETVLHGGICLRFEDNPDGTLWFAASRCHAEELFSKDVAKRIANHRARNYQAANFVKLGYLGGLEFTKETDLLVEQVIDWCMEFKPPEKNVHAFYLKTELHSLGTALESIMQQNATNRNKAEVWIAGLEATNVKKQYKDKQ